MSDVIEATQGKIRHLPIKASLRTMFAEAGAAAGVDVVRVTSGGQPPKGSGLPRTGSTRHDNGNAGDLQLEKGGRVLSFEDPQERPIVARFVTECARRGATGIGAGLGYMGPHTLHVGYGSRATWGAGGKSADAPGWLVAAVAAASGAAVAAPRVLRKGMSGPDVREAQGKLGVKQDGVFGDRTETALKAVQAAHGLTIDGVLGAASRAVLGL